MYYIKPVTVTNSVLTASNINEPDLSSGEVEWVSGTDYNVGDEVIRTATHKRYECSIKNPDKTIAPELDPDHWLEIGQTNKWAMFDSKITTKSQRGTSIIVDITPPSVCSKIAFIGVDASSIKVDVIVGGSIVYTSEVDLVDVGVSDWWEYFYLDYSYSHRAIFTLPTYRSCIIRATITAETGLKARCGAVILGKQIEIGDSLLGVRVGIKDFSTKETDAFGDTVIVQRDYSDKMSIDVAIPTSRIEYVRDDLATMRATPTVFVGEDEQKSTIIFGFIDNFEIILPNLSYSDCSISIEGLT